MKSILRLKIVALAVMVGISVVSAEAQTAPQPEKFSGIKIKNFGQMDTNYYRGAQPQKEDFQALAALGVKTVVDLRNDPVDYEKSTVEALGMKYINIPMDDAEYPKEESINRFLAIMNDESNGVVYVHCKGGKHRTGVTGAAYRFTKYGWDYDKTYREMENYAFHTKWGRKVMKEYVIDFAAKMREGSAAAASAAGGESNR